MPIYQKFNLQLAGTGALCRACHHQLALLDRFKSQKSVSLNHILSFPCMHLCCIHVNLVRAHTSNYFCTLPS